MHPLNMSCDPHLHCVKIICRGGGSNARLGGRELTLLCGFNQYTLLQNRDNSGLLGTPVYCSLKLGGDAPPMLKLGGGGRPPPPAPPVEPPLICNMLLWHIRLSISAAINFELISCYLGSVAIAHCFRVPILLTELCLLSVDINLD